MTIGMRNESEIPLHKLDNDYFGAKENIVGSAVAASHAAGAESYDSEEPLALKVEVAPAARCVDLDTSLVHIYECGSDDEELVVRDTGDVPDHRKNAASLTKVRQ